MIWNHDMSAAPRDGTRLLLVDQKGKVSLSFWMPPRFTASGKVLEGDRWSAFPRGYEPKAWMLVPEYLDHQSDVGEVAAVKGKARLAYAAGVEPPASGLFLLDDVGSGA